MYKVMVVEDDRGIAEGLKALMGNWGMEVILVEDFTAVMSTFAEGQPHLVLLDITLPFMNGYHWCQEIRKVSSVPIVFISSASDNKNNGNSLIGYSDGGMYGY